MHRSLLRFVLAVLCVTTPACDREKAPQNKPAADAKPAADGKPAAGNPTAEPGGCDAAHAKALEEEITAQCSLMPKLLELDVPSVLWKAVPSAAPEDALRIDVSPNGVVLGGWGEPIEIEALTPERFAEERDRMVEMAATPGRPRPESWVLAIDRTTTRLAVAKVLQALEGAGMRQGHLRLGTDSPGPLPSPRDPKLLAEVASKVSRGGPADKASLFARELESVVPGCPPTAEVFSSLAASPLEERCALMAQGLSQALVRCSCAKEAEILTLVYGLTVGLESPVRLGISVPVTLDPAAAPLPGDTWADMVAKLDETKLELWVSPT